MADAIEMEAPETQVAQESVPQVDAVVASTDNAPENASSSVPQVEPTVPHETSPKVESKELSQEELLAKLNLNKSEFEEFQKFQQAKKEEEERPLREQKKWAEITSFGINQGELTKDDVLNFEIVSKKSDIDLVRSEFEKDFVPSAEGLSEEEIQEEIDFQFKKIYHLTEDGKPKAKGELLLKSEANEIRKNAASKINSVEAKYNQVQSVRQLQKSHEETFKAISSAPLQDSVEIDGIKIDYEIPFEVTQDEVKAVLKGDGSVLLDAMYSVSSENKEAATKMYSDFVTQLAKEKSQKVALAKAIWDKADEHFKEKYSVGAKAPFKEGDFGKTETQAGRGMSEKEYHARKQG